MPISVFELALVSEAPMFVLAVVGLIFASTRLARTQQRAAFLWSVAGFVLLGVRSLVGPLAQSIMADALAPLAPTGDGIDRALSSALWSGVAANWLLVVAVTCLLVALLSNRAATDAAVHERSSDGRTA